MKDKNSKNCNILVVIPARGGSVGVPRKNIKDLNGQPLIAYVIKAALGTKYNLDVVVSTDDAEIARIAKHYGADVPFLRPKEISDSNTTLILVAKHAMEYFISVGIHYDAVLSLQPTAPLIKSKTIENAINKLKNNDIVISNRFMKSNLLKNWPLFRIWLFVKSPLYSRFFIKCFV